jgi:hypothetical protein
VAGLLMQKRGQLSGMLIHFERGAKLFAQTERAIESVRRLHDRRAQRGYASQAGEEHDRGGYTRCARQGKREAERVRNKREGRRSQGGAEREQEGERDALPVASSAERLQACDQGIVGYWSDHLHHLAPAMGGNTFRRCRRM